MTGDPDSPRPGGSGGDQPGTHQGWTALSYLIGGMVVWGLIGWLVDRWLGTGGIATAIGCVVGMAGGVYLVIRRVAP